MAGVMRAIKGNIWAIRNFADYTVFSPQPLGSQEGARGSPPRRMNYPSLLFTQDPLQAIVSKANSPAP
jgi:hypothetical protein